ncbi:hypothetical protein FRB96_007275 [Tulasnella sp. 330]|nr:hypothetical protein FRB96_007275 [Tulasnella sp. 330]
MQGLLAVSECPAHRHLVPPQHNRQMSAAPSTKPNPQHQFQGRSFLSFHMSISTKESSHKSRLPASPCRIATSSPSPPASPTSPLSPTRRALPLPKPAPSSSLPAIPILPTTSAGSSSPSTSPSAIPSIPLPLLPHTPISSSLASPTPASSTSYSIASTSAGPSSTGASHGHGRSHYPSSPSIGASSMSASAVRKLPNPNSTSNTNARRQSRLVPSNFLLNIPHPSSSVRNNHGHHDHETGHTFSASATGTGTGTASGLTSSNSVRSISSTTASTQYRKRRRHDALLALEGRIGRPSRTTASSRGGGGVAEGGRTQRKSMLGASFVPSILQEGDENSSGNSSRGNDKLLGVDGLRSHLSFTSWYTNGTSSHHHPRLDRHHKQQQQQQAQQQQFEGFEEWITLPSFLHTAPGTAPAWRSDSLPTSVPISYVTTSGSEGLFVEPSSFDPPIMPALPPRRKSDGETSHDRQRQLHHLPSANVGWGMNFMDLDDDSASSNLRYSAVV